MGVYENTLKDIEKTMGIVPGFMKGLPEDVLVQEWPLFKKYNFEETEIPAKRPSYVLGGRAMEIVFDETELKRYMKYAVRVSNESPVLLDRFLDDAIEVDVDAICDGKDVLIGGIMEHIEQAGVHSGRLRLLAAALYPVAVHSRTGCACRWPRWRTGSTWWG